MQTRFLKGNPRVGSDSTSRTGSVGKITCAQKASRTAECPHSARKSVLNNEFRQEII